jgi:hypothetical protein
MDSHSAVGFVYGRAIKTTNPEQEKAVSQKEFAFRVIPGIEYIRNICATSENVVDTPTAVVRTSVQRQVGGYRKDLPHAADMQMWLRIAAHGSVGHVEADQAYYRLHGHNMCLQYRRVRDFVERKAVFDSLFRDCAGRIRGAGRLQRLAHHALAGHSFSTACDVFDGTKPEDFREYLEFALTLYPGLRYSRRCCYFQVKRLLGPRVWSMLRPLVRRLRGSPDRPPNLWFIQGEW